MHGEAEHTSGKEWTKHIDTTLCASQHAPAVATGLMNCYTCLETIICYKIKKSNAKLVGSNDLIVPKNIVHTCICNRAQQCLPSIVSMQSHGPII